MLGRVGCTEYLAFLLQASQRFYGFQSPREDGPHCHASPGFWHRDVHVVGGERNRISPLKERHEGEGREERSKKVKQQQEARRRKATGEQDLSQNIPPVCRTTDQKRVLGRLFCEGRGCKLCSKCYLGVPGEPSPRLHQAKQLPLHTWSGPCGAVFDQKNSKFLLRWSLEQQSLLFSQFCCFFFSFLAGRG